MITIDPSLVSLVGIVVNIGIAGFVFLLNRNQASQVQYLKTLKDGVDTCIEDTKDCNKSISTLAIKAAELDTSVKQVLNRVDSISRKTHDHSERIVVLETHHKIAGGHD